MKTSIVLFGTLCIALAGCSTTPAEPSPGTGTAQQAPRANPHVLGTMPGDVVAKGIYARAPLNIARQLVTVSTPLRPGDVLGAGYAPEETEHTDILRVVPRGNAGVYKVPVDTTDGEAYLFLGPQSDDPAVIQAALRDVVVLDPNGNQVNARDPKPGAQDFLAMSAVPLAGHPAGTYTVQFKSGAAPIGLAIEARLAKSSIVMKLKPSTLEHLYGNEDYVDATLLEAGRPITGATVTADLVDGETLGTVTPLTFTEIGNGVYRAPVDTALTDASKIGAYLTDVRAEGTAPSGATFFRHGRTGFHYAVPTAKVLGITGQRIVTDGSGLISAFEVDVQIQSASLDRLEISARLANVGADGAEHPVAIAHAGAGFDAGVHTVTLHFDAGHVRLTRADGDLYVRDLQVFSLGTNSLFHRELAAANHVFPSIARAQLRPLATLTAAQKQLVAEGVFAAD